MPVVYVPTAIPTCYRFVLLIPRDPHNKGKDEGMQYLDDDPAPHTVHPDKDPGRA